MRMSHGKLIDLIDEAHQEAVKGLAAQYFANTLGGGDKCLERFENGLSVLTAARDELVDELAEG
jgi:hypothetical protein